MPRLAFFAGALAALATVTTAIPSPKINSVRYPPAYRGSLSNYTGDLAGDSFVSFKSDSDETSVVAPKQNVWGTLSIDEAADIVSFLHGTDLNLTSTQDAGTWDNYINVIDLMPPNKSDVVSFLDGEGSKPPRYAIVSIIFAATEEPYLEDYKVGPLPISDESTYEPFAYFSTRDTSKIRVRDADYDKVSEFKAQETRPVADIVYELTGGSFNNSDDDTLSAWGIDPLWYDHGRTISWQQFWGMGTEASGMSDSQTLLPTGLQFGMDITGRDPSDWKFLGWYWAGAYYPTTAAFRAAYEADGLPKLAKPVDGMWTSTDQQGEPLPLEEKTPPMQVETSSQRFKVDEDAKYVEWQGFSFYYSVTRNAGVRLWDIKFGGERIAYEWGLQEAVAHYAGLDPVQSGIGYLDTFYGVTPWAFPLVKGYDCPGYAKYMSSTYHQNELSTEHPESICLFEADTGHPLKRHSNGVYVQSQKDIAFNLRYFATIGNYDYSFTYSFHTDGTMESVVRASGYIQSAFWPGEVGEQYGYHIHDALSGSMHDHILTFKLDADIGGVNNTLSKHKFVPVDVKYPWSNTTRSTMKFETEDITNEDDGKLYWSENQQEMLVVENKDAPNKWGESRGYRLQPSKGGMGMHNTVQDSSNLLNSQSFVTHPVYVTKHKDSEAAVSHYGNSYDPADPAIDFAVFFDNEDIYQEDITIWYNLGMHHLPSTQDVSITNYATATSGMYFVPHNYFTEDVSKRSKQQVKIRFNDDSSAVASVEKFGQDTLSGAVNLTQLVPNYWEQETDVNTRKLPYDPLTAYNQTAGNTYKRR